MTQIVGILNVTPDSFSGDGVHSQEQTFAQVCSMIKAGAHMIDVGAESTRPGAIPLSEDQEWQRLEPVLPQIISLAHQSSVRVSMDTRHPENVKRATALGADMINDVSGLQNTEMLTALSQCNCPIIFMHSLTIPADPQITLPANEDIIQALLIFVQATLELAHSYRIKRERLIFDPGIGFNKTAAQSLEILRRIDELKALHLPLYIGHSRKSFLNQYTPLPPDKRDGLTLAASEYLLTKNIDYLRVHNVAEHMALVALHKDLHA